MNDQVKELIAIGASIGAHCQPCLEYHLGKAAELGLDADSIRMAVDIGHMVEKGAMAAMREFAKGVLDAPASAASSCCGGSVPKPGKKCCG